MKGITAHAIRLRNNAKRGAKTKPNVFAFVGITVSLTINLTASAIGCSNPLKPTEFGPFLDWIEPITLRSANVKKATAIKTGKTTIKKPTIFSRINIRSWD